MAAFICREIAKGNLNEDWAIRGRMEMVAGVKELIDADGVMLGFLRQPKLRVT